MVEKKRYIINSEHLGKGFSKLSVQTSGLVKKLLGKKRMTEIELLTNWENIVGHELSVYCLPHKITQPRPNQTGATLHLLTASGAFALEIQHKVPFILEKINLFFGYAAISKIKIIQNDSFSLNLQEPKFDDKPEKKLVTEQEQNYISEITDQIQNPELKESLRRLGESIYKQNK